jgi:2,3-dihydroxybenzoate-AMP ligase
MIDGWVPWPEKIAEEYRAAGYWSGSPLGDLTRDVAATDPDHTALIAGDRTWTYAELDTAADDLAYGLARFGLRPGDCVAVQLPNLPELMLLCLALFRLGVVPVMCLPGHRTTETAHVCRVAEAVALFTPDVFEGFDYRELAREVQAQVPTLRHVVVVGEPEEFTAFSELRGEPRPLPTVDAGDVAVLLLSGGTTGLPKLIPRTHNDLRYHAGTSARLAQFDESTRFLAVLPIAHGFAFIPGVIAMLQAGASIVLSSSGSPDVALPLIAQHKVTTVSLVPSLALVWARTLEFFPADVSSLRLIQVSGAALTQAVAEQVRLRFDAHLMHIFGMTEGLMSLTRLEDPPEFTTATHGRPISPADELSVVDEDGDPVPLGELGELQVRGPYTIRGYFRAPEHNAVAFTEDGYYCTGDLARLRPDGYLVVEGRVKDQINRGGEKISAAEVEEHILTHPQVSAVVVAGIPDANYGERVCAFVIVEGDGSGPELDLSDLHTHLDGRGLAQFKFPERLHIVTAWPLTKVGKVDRKSLVSSVS